MYSALSPFRPKVYTYADETNYERRRGTFFLIVFLGSMALNLYFGIKVVTLIHRMEIFGIEP